MPIKRSLSPAKPPFHQLSARLGVMLLLLLGFSGCSTPRAENRSAQNLQPSQPAPSAPPTAVIRYAVFSAPPYMIGVDADPAALSGIDVEIVQEMASRLNLTVEYSPCTWARCLELLKNGEADLLSSAYKKPEREEYLLYFSQPFLDQLPIAFYSLKDQNYSVTRYEDIYQFDSIGVLKGGSYFARFDQDTEAKKFEVSSQDQLFPMLLAGRLEAIAGYVPTENYRIAVGGYHDQIARSVYEYQEQAFVYLALSKKSPLAPRLDEFNRINQRLLAEGFIAKTVASYYEKYR